MFNFFQLIWGYMLNHACVSGVNSWCIVLLIHCWIWFASIFFWRILASIFVRILVCSSLDVFVFGRVEPTSYNESGKYSFLYFLEEIRRTDGIFIFSLNIWQNSSVKPCDPWLFFEVRNFKNYCFYIFTFIVFFFLSTF